MPCFPPRRGAIGAIVGGCLLVVAAAWFLLVSPQRSKASELETQLATSQAELSQRRLALAQPSAAVTIKPSDLYRLTKALPNDTGMSGILLDVNRLAGGNDLDFRSITPSSPVVGTGYVQQPLDRHRAGALRRRLQLPRRPPHARLRPEGPARHQRSTLLRHEGRDGRARQREEVPDRPGDRDASTPTPSAPRRRSPPPIRPRPPTRPRVGRSQQERPPDGHHQARRCRRRQGEEAEDHPRGRRRGCCSGSASSRARS